MQCIKDRTVRGSGLQTILSKFLSVRTTLFPTELLPPPPPGPPLAFLACCLRGGVGLGLGFFPDPAHFLVFPANLQERCKNTK